MFQAFRTNWAVSIGGSLDEQGPILSSGCTSGSDVTWVVADQDRASQSRLRSRAAARINRLGFAALVISLRGVGRQRVVGTCVYPVENNPSSAERCEPKGMDNHDVRLGSQSTANRSLIGNYDQGSTNPLSSGPGFQGEVDRLEVPRLDDVAVDDTPIQIPSRLRTEQVEALNQLHRVCNGALLSQHQRGRAAAVTSTWWRARADSSRNIRGRSAHDKRAPPDACIGSARESDAITRPSTSSTSIGSSAAAGTRTVRPPWTRSV